MTAIHRETPRDGRVIGIAVDHKGARLNVRAEKAVIVATGGSTGNVNFRRMFDPRLTEEYCGLAGMPWSDQDASGEIAAMAVGAALWGLFNYTGEFGSGITKPGAIGCQYGYVNVRWHPGSDVFDKARAIGLPVKDWQDVILVNMLGRRFYDETGGHFNYNTYQSTNPYEPHSYLNAKNQKYNPSNFINAALAGIGDGHNGGGPIWAIFDADAVAREKWQPKPPHVDVDAGFFFQADSIEALAAKIKMKYQRVPMPPQNLAATVARYNAFVDAGKDADFGKPKPLYKIAKPPFYAAWATPVIHDTRAGLRINARCQVDRHERRGDPRPLLRRRIGRRLFHARPAARGLSGVYRGARGGDGKFVGWAERGEAHAVQSRVGTLRFAYSTAHRPTLPSSPSRPGPVAAPALRRRKTAADARRAGAPKLCRPGGTRRCR